MGLVVLVPIFNASHCLATCFDSIIATLPSSAMLLMADDASTDPEVGPKCREVLNRLGSRAQLIQRQHNLGFVENVNRAIDDCPDSDVVILNSDTEVTPGWLERLVECAATDPRIATATPWSNNAEICSFPQFCRVNEMPDRAQAAQLAQAAATLSSHPPLDLPTGVGFAMWINRKAWDELGGFDTATFGKGYGEENDFCLRAAAHGWRNVLCPSAYVAHQGSASFAATGHRPGGENLSRLLARYPYYNARVASFIEADPVRPLRDKLTAALNAI